MRAQDNFRAPLLIQSGYLFHDAGPMQCNKYGSNCKTCAHFDRNEMYYLALFRSYQPIGSHCNEAERCKRHGSIQMDINFRSWRNLIKKQVESSVISS